MTLRELPIGQQAVVASVGGDGALRQHFLDMGLIPQAVVSVVKYAPMGDPMEISIHGYSLTLRLSDAEKIETCPLPRRETPAADETDDGYASADRGRDTQAIPHPGLGEGGRFHDHRTERALPEGTRLTFALAGNQNSGKTTLFNHLTGANQHVGNFPGVTVEQKSGPIADLPNSLVTDLPGIYSLSPYSQEEMVSRQFILHSHPRGIINIVDASNIERNLYLTMQLLELGVPMVVALNMMDEVEANHGTILINEMEQLLGVPVVPISARDGKGIDELVRHASHVARYQEPPARQDFCAADDHGGAVHRCIHAVMHLIEDHAAHIHIPLRFAACKLIEGDAQVLDALRLDQNELETVEHIIVQMERERGLDRAAAMADMRFRFILHLCGLTVVKPRVSLQRRRSDAIDRVLTGRWTGLPAFVAIMALVFWLTFFVIGSPLQDLADQGVAWLTEQAATLLDRWNINDVVASLVVDGVLTGVGTVLTFLPLIVTLFFFLSMLEDSGYMARIAFVTDSLLRRLGLSGRSIVPLLIGFGCSVPSVMATRTLSSDRDRKLTVILIPFMSCTAKLPIYAFFCQAFFHRQSWLVMTALYLLGILVGVVVALCTKGTLFRGEPVPFVMELPVYRLPGARNVLRLLWDKARDFLQRAFTVIFLATIVIWFLQTFDFHLNATGDQSRSILAVVAGHIAPLFQPMGYADWRVVTALVSGFMAKESVVSTLGVLSGGVPLTTLLTPVAAAALLVFCLLYTPCVAAVAAVRRELGTRWMLTIVVAQCLVAWCASLAAYWLLNTLF
ncbi:MAG: ferrous iron transport protein B [Prevotella sp.]|nr:ferrous iron transport protein B [Prevotella sp.]